MSDGETPQNIYDDPAFFAGYSTLERFGAGWERAVEHGDLLALLPDVKGWRALDLGCGAGQLAQHLATTGAAEVVGVDVSERMLALAREQWAHPNVTYRCEPVEDLTFPPSRFHLVVSSLVYSIEHPIYTARLPGDGWVLDDTGRKVGWSLQRYFDEGAREESWFVSGVRKVHRTIATLINDLVDAGLVVERVVEPNPSEAWLRDRPQFRDERHRPMFLLVRAKKPGV